MSQNDRVKKDDKRTINGWAIFDWANSAYALVITTAIFPSYFLSVTDSTVQIGNYSLPDSALYAYAISLAYILIAISSPFLSGIADSGGKKKMFLKFFTTLGSLACIALWFFKGMETLTLGTVSFVLATIGFAGGLVFYNAYLPEISSEDKYDSVSAKGFAYGYVGSVILLITNLIIINQYEWFGIDSKGGAVRLSFVMVGMWWLGFAQISFRRLPMDVKNVDTSKLVLKGINELKSVWRQLKSHKYTKRFLLAFFWYSAGAQTVIYLAATFAEKELGFAISEMIVLIIILQLVAIGGAYTFAKVSKLKGNKFAISIMLVLWLTICIMAYFVQLKWQFYLLGSLVGIVMGGIQSLSRSTYSKLIPTDTKDTASWFSFYDVLEKISIVTGTFTFGFMVHLTGTMRNSVLALGCFFILGLVILSTVKIVHGNTEPKAIDV